MVGFQTVVMQNCMVLELVMRRDLRDLELV